MLRTLCAVASAAALLILPAAAAASGEGGEGEMKAAACEMWSKLENKTLPLQNEGHANCTTNEECTGFTCKGIYQVRKEQVPFLGTRRGALTFYETSVHRGVKTTLLICASSCEERPQCGRRRVHPLSENTG